MGGDARVRRPLPRPVRSGERGREGSVTVFSCRNVSEAFVPVAPAEVWRVLADARELTALTPLLRSHRRRR